MKRMRVTKRPADSMNRVNRGEQVLFWYFHCATAHRPVWCNTFLYFIRAFHLQCLTKKTPFKASSLLEIGYASHHRWTSVRENTCYTRTLSFFLSFFHCVVVYFDSFHFKVWTNPRVPVFFFYLFGSHNRRSRTCSIFFLEPIVERCCWSLSLSLLLLDLCTAAIAT